MSRKKSRSRNSRNPMSRCTIDMISFEVKTQVSNLDGKKKESRKKSISGLLKKKSRITRTADFGVSHKLKSKKMKTDTSLVIQDPLTSDQEEKLGHIGYERSLRIDTDRHTQEKMIPDHLNFCIKDHLKHPQGPKKYETGSRSSFRKSNLLKSVGGIDLASVKERLKQLKKGSISLAGASSIRSGGSMKHPVQDKTKEPETVLPNSTSRVARPRRNFGTGKKDSKGTFSNMIKGSYSGSKKCRRSSDMRKSRYRFVEPGLEKKQKNLTNL